MAIRSMRGISTTYQRQCWPRVSHSEDSEELGEPPDARQCKEPRVFTTSFSNRFYCFRVFLFCSRCLPFSLGYISISSI